MYYRHYHFVTVTSFDYIMQIHFQRFGFGTYLMTFLTAVAFSLREVSLPLFFTLQPNISPTFSAVLLSCVAVTSSQFLSSDQAFQNEQNSTPRSAEWFQLVKKKKKKNLMRLTTMLPACDYLGRCPDPYLFYLFVLSIYSQFSSKIIMRSM